KSEISLIKYRSGLIDSFPQISRAPMSLNQTEYNREDKLEVFSDLIVYRGQEVSDYRLLKLISAFPDSLKRATLLTEYSLLLDYKKKQRNYGFGSLILTVAFFYTGLFAADLVEYPALPAAIGAGAGIVCGLTGLNLVKQYKKK